MPKAGGNKQQDKKDKKSAEKKIGEASLTSPRCPRCAERTH
jgi:hypothetical protein